MKRTTVTVCFLVIAGILTALMTSGCDENGGDGGGVTFPPPNPELITIAQKGQKTPDGQGIFHQLDRLAGPSDSGWVAFRSLESINEDTLRLVIYTTDSDVYSKVASNGDPAPGGGTFTDFPQNIGVNEPAQLAFIGTTAESPDDQFGDTDGYYLSGDAGIQALVREGDAAPGGGTVSKLCIPGFLGCFYSHGGLNDSGQIAFAAVLTGTSKDMALFLAGPDGVTGLARKGDAVPDGNGEFDGFYSIMGPNENGQVAFIAAISGTSGGEHDNEGVYIADESGVTLLAREGDPVPGGNGTFDDFDFVSGINESGESAFKAVLDGTSGGGNDNLALYIASGSGITELARKGDPVPGGGGGTIKGIFPTNPNENGEVAFGASISKGDEHIPNDAGIFLSGPLGITILIRVGDSGPDGLGRFTTFFPPAGLNESGEVIFKAGLFREDREEFFDKTQPGLYRIGPGESVHAFAETFLPVPPDGSNLIQTIEEGYQGPNNSGLALFESILMSADPIRTNQSFGIFIAR